MLDVRFLPEPVLRAEPVGVDGRGRGGARASSSTTPDAREFLDKAEELLAVRRSRASEREGKAYVTVAIGCTGGRHRSVAVVAGAGAAAAEAPSL